MRFISLCITVLFLWAPIASQAQPAPDRRILFIGNSFTFGGNVPDQVRQIAAHAATPVTYDVTMHVRGGTSLSQHIAETGALDAILSGDWDVVVLQDASAMPFREDLRLDMAEAAVQLATLARQRGAEVVYFAHWRPGGALQDDMAAIDLIETTYEGLAFRTGGSVARVGRLWLAAQEAGYDGLYSQDGHHASMAGAYVAALALTSAIGDVDPFTSTWAPGGVEIDPAQVYDAIDNRILFFR